MTGPDHIQDDLRRLHEAYVYKINFVLEQGREDLARELADAYTDEALRLMTALGSEA